MQVATVPAWDISAIHWLQDEGAIGAEFYERHWIVKGVENVVIFEAALISAESARVHVDGVSPWPVVVPKVCLVEFADVGTQVGQCVSQDACEGAWVCDSDTDLIRVDKERSTIAWVVGLVDRLDREVVNAGLGDSVNGCAKDKILGEICIEGCDTILDHVVSSFPAPIVVVGLWIEGDRKIVPKVDLVAIF